MKRLGAWALLISLCICARAAAQEILAMDDEPHYSRVFSNEYCRVYIVSLGRLEQTKPVVHAHNWVRMTLDGVVEQAWGGTIFSKKGYEDPEGYYISFADPVKRVTLRNPNNGTYRELIVEILKYDNSQNQANDPSLNPFSSLLGPGVDPHTSFVTSLTKTSIEILNVQLLSTDTRQIRSDGSGSLLVAMTDLDLVLESTNSGKKKIRLDKGEVKWMPDSISAAFKNEGKDTARFVLLGMK